MSLSQQEKTQEYLEILRGQRPYEKKGKGYCTASSTDVFRHYLKTHTGLPLHTFNPVVVKESCEERKKKQKKEEEDFKIALKNYMKKNG